MKKIFSFMLLALTIFFLSIAMPAVAAQDKIGDSSSGITVYPSVIDLNSFKGQSVFGSFTYENNTDSKQKISLEIVPYILSEGDKGSAVFYDINDNPILSPAEKWINLGSVGNPIVSVGEKRKINFSINIPEDADYGEYNNAIFVLSSPNLGQQNISGNIVNYRMGVLTILTVKRDYSITRYANIVKDPNLTYYILAIGALLLVFVILLVVAKKRNTNPVIKRNK